MLKGEDRLQHISSLIGNSKKSFGDYWNDRNVYRMLNREDAKDLSMKRMINSVQITKKCLSEALDQVIELEKVLNAAMDNK